ncbi:DUF3344 domain-containing protein [Methanosarcina acetivorans]|uniref:DUF3344 domain-containing protein n=1 Tax=Methanosarcina acetivorans (strain ATCC 35395 / DSM 2834 / JCM 12185 / C2A) TaxID=188937 RepID=Q8TQ07_METAC|nr:DUF3344 domain-containing protein [Methanosarcina acetivorans]AAM05152.1 predicted protein [Methanosarcina acetivorans C2A]
MDTGKKILIAGLLGVGLLFLILFFSGNGGWQGDGIPPYTIAEGTVRGEVYVDGGHGYTGENPYLQYFELPLGDVKYARLYVPVWNYDSGDSIRVTVNGKELAVRQEPDYASAWGTALYCLESNTSLGPGLNEVSVLSENPGGGPYGITLVAVCENRSLPPVRFWINEGNYALTYTNKQDRVTSTFKGASPGKNASLYAMLVAGTEGEKDDLYFDSLKIGSDVGNSSQGKYFDLYSTSVSPKSTESILSFERGEEGYLHPCVAVLVSESESDSEFLKLHEQKSSTGGQIPYSVIVVSILACLALVLRFRKK